MKREKRLGIPFFSPSPDDQHQFDELNQDDPEGGINRARLHFGNYRPDKGDTGDTPFNFQNIPTEAIVESRKRKYGDGYELGDESDELPIDHHVMFPQGETRSFRGPDESPDMQAVRAIDAAMGRGSAKPIQAPIGSHPLFVMGNPMDMAWRLLKMTPDEMRQQGFGDAAKQMEEMKQEEARLNAQRQAEQQRMKRPEIQRYNLQLAQRQAQRDMNTKIKRARKAGGRLDSMFPEIHTFAQEHGKLPIMPRRMKERFLDYRARMEEE